MKKLSFTKQQFIEFKKKYEIAVKNNSNSFMFKNNEFLTAYAKYLLQYLEPQF